MYEYAAAEHRAKDRESRVYAEKSIGLGIVESDIYIKSIPTHEKTIAVGKSVAQMPLNSLCMQQLNW